MKIINNNPYRIIGILVGASAKEKERQIRKLKQYLEAEQEPQDDFSLPALSQIKRTIETVTDAASKLNLDNDKINSALFWFYNGNDITDEPALDALKESNQNITKEIWEKLITTGEVTQRNASAYHNLSTLLLSELFDNSSIDSFHLTEAISLKLKFLESDFVRDFKKLATDETFKTTKKELQLSFLNQLYNEIDGKNGITPFKFLEIIQGQEFTAKDEFIKYFIQNPIERIEKQIGIAKTERKANKKHAAKIGKKLFTEAADSIDQLKAVLGITNIKFSSISDKLASEILQCGIDYYSYFKDTETDLSATVMDLFQKAEMLAVGNIARQRCEENKTGLKEWIEEKPLREKQKLIEEDFQFITSKLEALPAINNKLEGAIDLIKSCKPKLEKIKDKLGNTDEMYIMISSTVVSNVQGLLVAFVNDAVEKRSSYVNYMNNRFNFGEEVIDLNMLMGRKSPKVVKEYSIELLLYVLKESWKATVDIGKYDMTENLRQNYERNKTSLKELYMQVSKKVIIIKDIPVPFWALGVGIAGLVLILTAAIWGKEGLNTAFIILCVIGFIIFMNYAKK